MTEKIVKARKRWLCDHCCRWIEVGEKYTFGTTREPNYTEDVMGNDIQDGIRYIQWRLCLRDDCNEYGANMEDFPIRGETRNIANIRSNKT